MERSKKKKNKDFVWYNNKDFVWYNKGMLKYLFLS